MFTIEKQKRVMWIPLLNVMLYVTFPFWIRNLTIGSRAFWMMFVYSFGPFLLGMNVVRMIQLALPQAAWIVFICNIYLIPLFLNYCLIRWQIKYLNK